MLDGYGNEVNDEYESAYQDHAFTQPNYVSTQEIFSRLNLESQDQSIDITLLKDHDPCAILIEEIDLHGLINALLIHWKPYNKEVRLVASFSFTNSMHKSAEIISNGPIITQTNKANFSNIIDKPKVVKDNTDWFGINMSGIYSLKTLKSLASLLKTRLIKSLESNITKQNETIIISWTAIESSNSLNWIDKNLKPIKKIIVEIDKEDNGEIITKFKVKYIE